MRLLQRGMKLNYQHHWSYKIRKIRFIIVEILQDHRQHARHILLYQPAEHERVHHWVPDGLLCHKGGQAQGRLCSGCIE